LIFTFNINKLDLDERARIEAYKRPADTLKYKFGIPLKRKK